MGSFDFFEMAGMMASMAKAQVESDRAYRQAMLFDDDKEKFEEWFENYSKNYIALRDIINSRSYQVDRKVFHGSWLTGKAKADGKSIDEENAENNRRKKLIEDAIQEQSFVYMDEVFKKYLSETENKILDSYNIFCMFQNELSYLLKCQKDILDSIYLNEVKELLGATGREVALTKIKDFAWQIERHKKYAGHAVVLLMITKFVYYGNSGFKGDIKNRIEDVLLQAEDIIIDNTYSAYLTEEEGCFDAGVSLQAGKELFVKGEPEKAFAFFLCSSKKGNVEAQYRVGVCFENGYGVWKNKEKAVFWYKKSAESDNPVSKYYIAKVYQEVNGDYSKAFEYYRRAFEDGVADAARKIGDIYVDREENYDSAFEWYERGAAAGSPWAMYRLYLAYMNGFGVEIDKEIAEKWFTKCVDFFELSKKKTENLSAEEDSATLYETESMASEECGSLFLPVFDMLDMITKEHKDGNSIVTEEVSISTDETEGRANEFHGNLLSPGCDSIFGVIAKEYKEGSSVIAKDDDRARTWYEKGAAIGNVYILCGLADIYAEKGWNTDCVKYARRAAEYGCSEAMNKMGICYYNGKGVDKDKVIANMWFLRAAKTGNKWGQRNIAFEFLSGGLGIPQDIKEARLWLALAAEQGVEECQKKLVELDEHDKEKRKQEAAREKEKLEKKKIMVLSEISEILEKIDAAQSQSEEEALIKKKDALGKKVAALDEEINKYK